MTAAPSPVAIRTARAGLIVLTLINLFNYLDRWIVAALAESMKRSELHLSDTQLGFLMTGFLFVYLLAAPLFGTLGDTRSRNRLLAIGVALWSVATALAGLARNYVGLFAARQPGHRRGVAAWTYGTLLSGVAPQSALPADGAGLCRVHICDRRAGILDADVPRARARHPQGARHGTVRRDRGRHRLCRHIRRRLDRRSAAAVVAARLPLALGRQHAARRAADVGCARRASGSGVLAGHRSRGAVPLCLDRADQLRDRQRGLAGHACHRHGVVHLHDPHPGRRAVPLSRGHDLRCALA